MHLKKLTDYFNYVFILHHEKQLLFLVIVNRHVCFLILIFDVTLQRDDFRSTLGGHTLLVNGSFHTRYSIAR
jgi:hypothetical protein